eukprot:14246798-Alexandrium_andersonii.AAC.1
MLAIEPRRGTPVALLWSPQTLRPGRQMGVDRREVVAITRRSAQAPNALPEQDWVSIAAELRGLEGSAGPLPAIT